MRRFQTFAEVDQDYADMRLLFGTCGSGKSYQNFVLAADMIMDSHPVVFRSRVSRWKIAGYIYVRGGYTSLFQAYLQVLRFSSFYDG